MTKISLTATSRTEQRREMTTMAAPNPEQRAGIRRTVWIVGGMAFVIFVLFFVKQFFWH